jgi:hypothetical protein
MMKSDYQEEPTRMNQPASRRMNYLYGTDVQRQRRTLESSSCSPHQQLKILVPKDNCTVDKKNTSNKEEPPKKIQYQQLMEPTRNE